MIHAIDMFMLCDITVENIRYEDCFVNLCCVVGGIPYTNFYLSEHSRPQTTEDAIENIFKVMQPVRVVK